MSDPRPACEKCGVPAVVHVTNDGGTGTHVRHFCLRCADAEETDGARGEPGLNRAAVLIAVGLLVLATSVLADVLKIGAGEGFGLWQRLGVLVAGLLVLMATLTRTLTLLVIGLITGAVTVLADWLGLAGTEGFGLKQMFGSAAGVLMVVMGLLLGRRPR